MIRMLFSRGRIFRLVSFFLESIRSLLQSLICEILVNHILSEYFLNRRVKVHCRLLYEFWDGDVINSKQSVICRLLKYKLGWLGVTLTINLSD